MYLLARERDRKREITPRGKWPCHNPFSSILLLGFWACTHTTGMIFFSFFFWGGRGFCYWVHALARKTQRRKARNHPPGGMATSQSLLLFPSLEILDTYTDTRTHTYTHTHTPSVNLTNWVQDSTHS